MPLLDNENAIREYYEQEKEKYPDLTYEQFKEICRSPSQFFKQCIRGNGLPRILVKHLGKFRVFPSRLKKELTKYTKFFEKGIIDEDTYNQNTIWANYHLKNIENEITEANKNDEEQAID
jgi:hypothetical protein